MTEKYYAPHKVVKWSRLLVMGVIPVESPFENCIGFIPVFQSQASLEKQFPGDTMLSMEPIGDEQPPHRT
jgi:hypothetical protein